MHALLLVLALAAPPRFALVGFEQGAGVEASSYRAIVDSIAGEIRRVTQAQLITPEEIKTLLSAEEQKQLLGCTGTTCFAEIGGALGAERILTGSIGKAGTSLVLFIKAVHTRKIGDVRQVSRRFKGGNIDDVLDAIPGAVAELFPTVVATMTTTPFDREGWAKPRPHPEEQNIKQRVRVFADDQGHVLLVEPTIGSKTLVFHGGSAGLFQLRVLSASRNGIKHTLAFWDPRYDDAWKRSVIVDGDQATIRCGEKTFAYKTIAGDAAATALKKPLQVPLVGHESVALGIDADNNYYYVDRDKSGHRLFVGKKGSVGQITIDDVSHNDSATTYRTALGRLVVQDKSAEWITGERALKLELASLNAKEAMVFRELGVYPALLGTPCD